jgi:hypothetical protein
MRCLHVVDTLEATPAACGLLALLRIRSKVAAAAQADLDTHDVLAFRGGPLDDRMRVHARRLFVASGGLEVAAILHARAYDVVHALEPGSGHRLAPYVLGASQCALVYSGRLATRPGSYPRYGRAADDSLVAASDLAILDASTEPAFDARLDRAGRVARLDLTRSGEALPDRSSADGDCLASSDFALREWLSLLARAAVSAVAA